MKKILGLECSCDDASASIVENGNKELAETTVSLADEFAKWGGVVPEIAARGHVASWPKIIEETMEKASVSPSDIDAIAVASWPGLMGSLLCASTSAKILAARWNKPLIAVDHIQAHLSAVNLNHKDIKYPAVGLVASGGHSHYYYIESPNKITLLGGTIDDAAGEAFDKAASMLELGYPGGPIVDKLAKEGNDKFLSLPRSFIHDKTIRLSFSGLKTAFLYKIKGPKGLQELSLSKQEIKDACASFQTAVVDALLSKLLLCVKEKNVSSIIVGGGVACNSSLRNRLLDLKEETVYIPEAKHCQDNGSMVASLGHYLYKDKQFVDLDFAPLPTGKAGPRKK